MDSIRSRAQQLVDIVGARGIVSTIREALLALRRNRNNLQRASDFIAARVARDREAYYRSNMPISYDRYAPGGMRKRRRFVGGATVSGSMAMDVTGNAASAGYQAITFCKSKVGRKKPVNAISKVIKEVRANDKDLICRWQSILSPQPSTASLLSMDCANTISGNTMYTGCRVWNLSALGYYMQHTSGATASAYAGLPCYRLFKDLSATIANRAWKWIPEGGVKNNHDGSTNSAPWQVEHSELPQLNMGPQTTGYSHDWTDIRLLFQGTNKYPVRFHIYFVKFLQNGIGPLRYSSVDDAAESTLDENPTDADEIGVSDYFWERFMFPKIVHPFGVTKRPYSGDKTIQVLKHEVISLNSELSISSDVQPLQHMKRIFYRNGASYSLNQPRLVEQEFMRKLVEDVSGIRGDGKVGFSDSKERDSTTPYDTDRSKDTWLMVVPENYQVTSTPTTDNAPSMDICLRNKYTVVQKT